MKLHTPVALVAQLTFSARAERAPLRATPCSSPASGWPNQAVEISFRPPFSTGAIPFRWSAPREATAMLHAHPGKERGSSEKVEAPLPLLTHLSAAAPVRCS